MAFPKGTKVRQVIPVIEGTVSGFSVDQETGERLVLVSWKDKDGNDQHKYFGESQIEAVPPPE